MRFDLHIHSTCSDGHAHVHEIIKVAVRRGLHGLAITDHDTLRGSAEALRLAQEQRLKLIIISGAEITTSEGHLLVLGIDELPKKGLSPEETIDEARDLGGIAIVPHPYHPLRKAIGRIPECDAVEVYNSKHVFGIANLRARLEASRRGIPMIAGSDSHYAETVGLGITDIDADDGDEALRAICLGRTRIVGRRTPPRFFLGNTFRALYLEAQASIRRI